MLSLQKRNRSLIIIAVAFIMSGLVLNALLPLAAGQPGEWKSITPTASNLNSIFCLPAPTEKCWAVGNSGTIAYWDSVTSRWKQVTSPVAAPIDLHSIYMLTDTDGWAVGDADASGSTILHWDGVSWSRILPVPG